MRLLSLIGLLALLAAAAGAFYFFGGYYNVAANQDDPAGVDWALVRVRQASIAKHATEAPPFPLTDAARIQEGARAFSQRGCTNCHGGPGVEWAKFSEGLKPGPPDLKEVAPKADPAQLFWVIKNGIRMTGMPSFGQIEVPDQEIWSIVAFVKALPSVTDEQFKTWTAKP
jgi:cytochrome c1